MSEIRTVDSGKIEASIFGTGEANVCLKIGDRPYAEIDPENARRLAHEILKLVDGETCHLSKHMEITC